MISKDYANELLKHICGVTDSIMPETLYLGLCTSEPTSDDGDVPDELAGEGYARVPIGGSQYGIQKYFVTSTKFPTNPKGGIITNALEIQFKTARQDWGTANYFFLSKGATGNAIMWGEVKNKDKTLGVTITKETVPVFYEGDLKASIDVDLTESE